MNYVVSKYLFIFYFWTTTTQKSKVLYRTDVEEILNRLCVSYYRQ